MDMKPLLHHQELIRVLLTLDIIDMITQSMKVCRPCQDIKFESNNLNTTVFIVLIIVFKKEYRD